MAFIEYPKIYTLFERDDNFNLTDKFAYAEFGLIDRWYVTEKIDGTNVRIHWDGKEAVTFGLRTSLEPAHFPPGLLALLQGRFPVELLQQKFGDKEAVLFGEGYGAGVQKGGIYRPDKDLIVFDCFVDNKYWLEPAALKDVSAFFNCRYVPELGMLTTVEICDLVKDGFASPEGRELTGKDSNAEGIIARSVPGLMLRYQEQDTGNNLRLMFKLKQKDFKVKPPKKTQEAVGVVSA